MKISELKTGDEILFLMKDYYNKGQEIYEFGNISYIDTEDKLVSVTYLEGYKSCSETIPFNKVIAKGDVENGVNMKFKGVSGKGVFITDYN